MTINLADTRLPHSCGGCSNRWAGANTAHCGGVRGCHHTFSSPSGFDRHRRNGTCLAPAAAGLVPLDRVGYTAWGSPADEASIERLRALRGVA